VAVIFVKIHSRGTVSPYYALLLYRGVCGNYIGVFRLPVKTYVIVKYGNVYRFNSYCHECCLSNTYTLVCLLAGAGVMPGVVVWSPV
jgi:hypothetical protein